MLYYENRRETRKSKVINRERFTGGRFAPVSPGRALSFLWVIVMKTCTKCKESKSEAEFHKHRSKSDGLRVHCKECRKKDWAEKSDQHKAYKKKRYNENREEMLESRRSWGRKNKKWLSQYNKEYREKNRAKISAKQLDYMKKRLSDDPLFYLKHKLAARMRDTLRDRGYNKTKTTIEALGCTIEYFHEHIEKQFLKGMTWDNRDEWHLDHIIPISSAKNEQEVYALSHFTNIRPLWAKDNLSKGAKLTMLI